MSFFRCVFSARLWAHHATCDIRPVSQPLVRGAGDDFATVPRCRRPPFRRSSLFSLQHRPGIAVAWRSVGVVRYGTFVVEFSRRVARSRCNRPRGRVVHGCGTRGVLRVPYGRLKHNTPGPIGSTTTTNGVARIFKERAGQTSKILVLFLNTYEYLTEVTFYFVQSKVCTLLNEQGQPEVMRSQE